MATVLTGRGMAPGNPWPMGASWDGAGVNFALFSAHAEKVELCLFDAGGEREIARHPLPEQTHQVWHGYLPGAEPGCVYGYRVYGAYDPHAGHRFNHHKLLLDPYARRLRGQFQWSDTHFGYKPDDPATDLSFDTRDNAAWMPKAVVVGNLPGREPSGHSVPWADTVLYETHVRGFTRLHPRVPEHQRGTFAGLATQEVIDYLKSLGITSVELLPVHAFIDEHFLYQRKLTNYWGYNTLAYFAPHGAYLSDGPSHGLSNDGIAEFRQMVDRFHDAGLEVILDVVYNHSAESNRLGPTLSFRGIDNASYYRLQSEDKRFYVNDSGCGNTLNIGHPRVLQLVMDSLRYWAGVMGVDGFRFDLAPVLGRDGQGFRQDAPLFQAIAQDPLLSTVKLIAEPWDIGAGGYQLGNFPAGWSEWNDSYRDTVRRFWRGEPGVLPEFARRLHGSSDIFEHAGRRPYAAINYVTSHDGFTLRDLVSYRERHNQANCEDNNDGHQHNISENFGVEGDTDNGAIGRLRRRQQRNLLATLMVSQGVPMLQAGDELGRTQRGNNNAYCQDNPLSWLDWAAQQQVYDPLRQFLARLTALRRQYRVLRYPFYIHITGEPSDPGIYWLNDRGLEMREKQWQEHGCRLLGYLLSGPLPGPGDDGEREVVLVVINGSRQVCPFQLPSRFDIARWTWLIDTVSENGEPAIAGLEAGEELAMQDLSVAIFCGIKGNTDK